MTDMLDTPERSIPLATWLMLAFIAGFLSVLTFHQGAIGIAHMLGWAPNPPYPMRPVPPLGVPQFVSLAFWGGVWFTVFALVATRLPLSKREGIALVVAGALFGAFVI